jgi:hypothetical protein
MEFSDRKRKLNYIKHIQNIISSQRCRNVIVLYILKFGPRPQTEILHFKQFNWKVFRRLSVLISTYTQMEIALTSSSRQIYLDGSHILIIFNILFLEKAEGF